MYNNIVIYWLGYIVAFFLLKPIFRWLVKDLEGPNAEPEWIVLLLRILLSFGSWLIAALALLFMIIHQIYKFLNNSNINIKPPKWL